LARADRRFILIFYTLKNWRNTLKNIRKVQTTQLDSIFLLA